MTLWPAALYPLGFRMALAVSYLSYTDSMPLRLYPVFSLTATPVVCCFVRPACTITTL